MTLGPENRKEVAVSSQHVRFVFNPNGSVAFVHPLALSDDAIGKLDGGPIEENEIHGISFQHTPNFVGKACPAGRRVVEASRLDEHAHVDITERPRILLHL